MDAIHTLVPRALADLFSRGPISQGKLEVAWRVAVGDALCRVSTVRLQPDGSVEVQPSDQRWHKELKRSSSMILSRLHALLGANSVTRLVVK
ncbi:MAG TPA: DciA family protein [Vicinamibacterales bacterium]|nr:DciA family protein [Vicinamibacterales bacterium]